MHRSALILVAVIATAACGGTSKPAASERTAPADPGEMPAYCQSYEACANEAEREDRDLMNADELTAAQQAELTAGVATRLDACRATWDALTPHQQEWLESCTGCGGSCDVYDCLDQAGSIADGVEFECDMNDDAIDSDGAEDDGDD